MSRLAFAMTMFAFAVVHAEGFPASVTLPAAVKAPTVEVENFGQVSMKTSESDEVVVAGKHFSVRLDTTAVGDDPKVWGLIVDALKKSGWQLVFGNQHWNPPYASLKLVKAGKETWFDMWVSSDNTQINVIEKGASAIKLALTAPTDGIAKVGAKDDFPFLKKLPGSTFAKTTANELPFMVQLEADKDGVMVAAASTVKEYDLPKGTSPVEPVIVYRDALKAAGWIIVEEHLAVTTNDPNITAHYAKGTVDLWVHVRGSDTLQLEIGDAGTEHASTKLKAELDKTCKVAIYGVNFDFDKATLRTDATPALDSIFKLLTDYKDLKVELGGHTDNVGERGYNQKLSESRVTTVKTWLTKKGIAADRVTAKGYADTAPIVANDSPENRAKNRRVELKKLDCKK